MLSANEKEETFASNVKIVIFAGILNKQNAEYTVFCQMKILILTFASETDS